MHKYLLNFLVMVAPVFAQGQVTLSNTNSYYGIGIMATSGDPIQKALGNSSFAYTDSTMVNYYNSAAQASVTKGYPLFSLALSGEFSQMNDGVVSKSSQFTRLEHMYIAIPFAKRFAFTFGITPYSRRGYSFQTYSKAGSDSLRFEYDGKGNISKAFGAFSANIINRKNFGWAIGSNLGYLYGQTSNTRTSIIIGKTEGGASVSVDRLRSFHYDLSSTVRYQLNSNNRVHFSIYFDPSQKLRADGTEEYYYFKSGSAANLLSLTDTTGKITSAPALKLGVNYVQKFHRISKKNKEFDSEINYLVEYQKTTFTDFRFAYKTNSVPYNSDFSRVSLGIQYTPNVDFYKNLGITSIWNRMKYRIGAYSSSLPYSANGQNYKEFGTTFGIGIPLIAQFSYSSLNVGFDLGKRSSGGLGAINEKFINFNIGVIISPSNADRWFRKVKLD